jgi:hypothetical protein
MAYATGLRLLSALAWLSTFIPPFIHGPILGVVFWLQAKKKERERARELEAFNNVD